MNGYRLIACYVVAAAAAGAGCQLPRPEVEPLRMIEPRLEAPPAVEARADAVAIRMLETQARGHVGRRVLHRVDNGELSEDRIWRWSSVPDRYLDSALRSMFAASPALRLVDAAGVPTLAVNLTEWYLDDTSPRRLVGAVEVTITNRDRTVTTVPLRAEAPVAPGLPGDLAAVAGKLLGTLAGDCLRLTEKVVQRPAGDAAP